MESILFSSIGTTVACPTIIRESINWRTVAAGIVEISVDVVNANTFPTGAATMVIEAAPLGAFVAGPPVATVDVEALAPGEFRTVRTQAQRRQLDRLGRSGMLFAAASFPETSSVAIDPRVHEHWIGNLNVYFDRDLAHAVERHRLFGVRVPMGSLANAAFIVMDRTPCDVMVECSSSLWTAALREPSYPWHRSRMPALLRGIRIVSIQSPDKPAEYGNVVVLVKRRRDGRTVPVEFELETVDGAGDTLGCTRI